MDEIRNITSSNKYSDSYNELLVALKEAKHTDSVDSIDKAFSILICEKENENTFFTKDLIQHVLDSAIIAVKEIGLGYTSVIGLFLYHAGSESSLNIEKIIVEFGEQTSIIVDGLAKVSKIDENTTYSQAENYRRLLLNLAKDVRVILLLLAEQTALMREMRQMKNQDQLRIAVEASFLYAPLAHRLGLYLIKSEMEDLSLKYTDRHNYDIIAKKLDATMKDRRNFISDFIRPIKDSISNQGLTFDIKGRPKSIFSIWTKMKKKEVEFEDLYDLFAIRIIIDSELHKEKADCWQVYSAVTDIYQPNPQRLRDWISVPKSNGYESLHTTVIGPDGRWVEVQIRTKRMNEIAEKGVAAHWKYKGLEGEHGIDSWLAKVREILETPEPDAGSFIDDFKLSLYSKEIFVFTPKGELRKFPEGATVLDFAYDIHTDVGSTCTGARINGKNVPIRHKLQNGDRVEVMTSKNQIAKIDWLNFVVTTKAQKKIRQRLNEEKVKEAEKGKEILQRRFKNWKIEYGDEVIRNILKKYKLSNAQDLYGLISQEKIDLTEIKDFIKSGSKDVIPEITENEYVEIAKRQIPVDDSTEGYLVIDENLANVDFKLAKCCNPILGDNIFGFVSIGEGIKIHRTNCPNAVQLIGKYGYRIVKAKWHNKAKESVFPVIINVTGEDQTGILSSISETISKDLKVSVRSISLDADNGLFSGKISLLVKDIEHLNSLINRLAAIKGIYTVSRFEGGK
jgi:GTP diphosphokinase / guanosine-3',5'-bis(diphosphate) 3'-diphosphatase